jgi:FKBP-type peptidyl-prolyl cis-trans isomerase 2
MKTAGIIMMICVIALAGFIGVKMTGQTTSSFEAKIGDLASVEYELRLNDGELIDSSIFEFEIGSGQVIKGFDEAVIGMKVGEEKEVSIPPKDAYGEIGSGSTHDLAGETLNFKIKLLEIK